MKRILLLLFIGISVSAFAQHPCTPPSISIHTTVDSICPGGFATLTAIASGGNTPYTYLWSSGATTSSVVVAPTHTTTYSITVKNSCGDSNKATIIVTVVPPPTLVVCCNNTINHGDSILLVAGTNAANYQWSPLIHCLNPSLCDSVMATPTVTTTYTVTGANVLGCRTVEMVTITVGPTGVPSISETGFINVYPNPSATVFNVTLEKKALLNVCDITGRVLFSEMENPGIIAFGKELNPGLYFLFIDGKPAGKLEKL